MTKKRKVSPKRARRPKSLANVRVGDQLIATLVDGRQTIRSVVRLTPKVILTGSGRYDRKTGKGISPNTVGTKVSGWKGRAANLLQKHVEEFGAMGTRGRAPTPKPPPLPEGKKPTSLTDIEYGDHVLIRTLYGLKVKRVTAITDGAVEVNNHHRFDRTTGVGITRDCKMHKLEVWTEENRRELEGSSPKEEAPLPDGKKPTSLADVAVGDYVLIRTRRGQLTVKRVTHMTSLDIYVNTYSRFDRATGKGLYGATQQKLEVWTEEHERELNSAKPFRSPAPPHYIRGIVEWLRTCPTEEALMFVFNPKMLRNAYQNIKLWPEVKKMREEQTKKEPTAPPQ